MDLSAFGVQGHPGISRGAPVEVAFSPDGTKAYVSNYSMYGNGWGPEGSDECQAGNHYDRSYVYRVDVKTMKIDNVILVGSVPKYVATTPDGRYVIVTNWCSYDASIIDVATQTEVQRIPLGPYPRGIVVSPDSRTAYIAVMGSTKIARVDLTNLTTSWIYNVGSGPRHLVLSPDGRTLYATLNGEGRVAKIDPVAGAVQAKVATGSNPRSMTISSDGKYLFVVNYESGTMSKLDANTMANVQTVQDRVPSDRHHLRPPDQRRVGGELHRLDHDLQQRLTLGGSLAPPSHRDGTVGRMAIVLGLLAALSWGTGDFAGGMATRQAAETAVVLGTETIGLVLLLVIAPFAGGSPHASDLGLGAVAGVLGVAGLASALPRPRPTAGRASWPRSARSAPRCSRSRGVSPAASSRAGGPSPASCSRSWRSASSPARRTIPPRARA